MIRENRAILLPLVMAALCFATAANACSMSGGADDIHNCRGGAAARGSNNGDGGKAEAYGRLGTALGGFIGSLIELGRQDDGDDAVVRRPAPTVQDRRNAAYSAYGNQIRGARSAADCAAIADITARAICEEPFAAAIKGNLNARFDSIGTPAAPSPGSGNASGGSWQSVNSRQPDQANMRPGKTESIDPDSGMSASSCLRPSGSRRETYLSGDTSVCFSKSETGRCEGYSVTALFFNSCRKSVNADVTWDHGKTGYVSVPGGQTGTALCTAEPNGVMCTTMSVSNEKF